VVIEKEQTFSVTMALQMKLIILKDGFIPMFLFPCIHSISVSGIYLLLTINISLTIIK